jgi:hypothetical protein
MVLACRLVADRFVEAHPDGVVRIQPDNPAVLHVNTWHTVACGGNKETIVKADIERAGRDIPVPIRLPAAQAEVPFAHDCRSVPSLLHDQRQRCTAWLDDHTGVTRENTCALFTPSVFACQHCIA